MPSPPGNRRNLSEALRIAEMVTGEAVSRFQQFVTRPHKLRRITPMRLSSNSPLPIRGEIPSSDSRRSPHKLRRITPMRLSSSSPLLIRGEIPSGDSRRSPHESCPVNRSEPPSSSTALYPPCSGTGLWVSLTQNTTTNIISIPPRHARHFRSLAELHSWASLRMTISTRRFAALSSSVNSGSASFTVSAKPATWKSCSFAP